MLVNPSARARPAPHRRPIRVRGRSHTALVLSPELPIAAWLAGLDALLQRSPGAFTGRFTLLNVSALCLSGSDLADLVTELRSRDIPLMGIEGADPSILGPDLPPLMKGGGSTSIIDFSDATPPNTPNTEPSGPGPAPKRQASLQLENP